MPAAPAQLRCSARNYIEQALVALPERLEVDNLLHGYGFAEVLESAFEEARHRADRFHRRAAVLSGGRSSGQ